MMECLLLAVTYRRAAAATAGLPVDATLLPLCCDWVIAAMLPAVAVCADDTSVTRADSVIPG